MRVGSTAISPHPGPLRAGYASPKGAGGEGENNTHYLAVGSVSHRAVPVGQALSMRRDPLAGAPAPAAIPMTLAPNAVNQRCSGLILFPNIPILLHGNIRKRR
jgi:hypothetical protein